MQHGQWVFIAPISGLELTKAVSNEFRVLRVTFVNREKLSRIRQRLGIPLTFSETKKQITESDYFDAIESKTFAILRHSGKPADITSKCLQLIKDELDILSLSQLGFGKRRLNAHPSLRGNQPSGKISHLFLNRDNPSRLYSNRLTGKFLPLTLDQQWRRYQRKIFFLQLLKILNKDISISSSWRNDLYRAAILIGQSQYSSDIAQSFLWNMIALELLLTKRGDKYTEELPRRIEAFLGWVGYWDIDNYEKQIKDIYKKRCQFVHDGQRDNINIADLQFINKSG